MEQDYTMMTYENMMERCLSRVSTDVDKREGSIIYDALAPAVAELAQMYIELSVQADQLFAETATDLSLERAIAWSGITRKPSTKAQLRGTFVDGSNVDMDVPIGSRFFLLDMTYRVAERIAEGSYRLEAEVEGARGNQNFGPLLPIDYIANLARAELTELLIPGVDEESDEDLRIRYMSSAQRPATSGNKHHYMEWALQMPNVGSAKVFPLWKGPKTVKVVIVDSDLNPATSTLVTQVQNVIDPMAGRGEGKAPIGAEVTVSAGVGKTINLKATLTLAAGYSLQGVIQSFNTRLEAWRRQAVFKVSYVSLPVVGSLLLSTEGVIDYTGLTLNGGTGNIALADDEIPIIGKLELGV